MSCNKVIILVVHHDSSKDLEIPLTNLILKELTRVLLKHKTNESLPQVTVFWNIFLHYLFLFLHLTNSIFLQRLWELPSSFILFTEK